MSKKVTVIICFLVFGPYVISMFWSYDMMCISSDSDMVPEKTMGKIIVEVEEDAGVRQIFLENYIIGVLPSVMPVSYETEALKAQAVLLRTWLIREYGQKDGIIKPEGPAWMSVEQMKEVWGQDFTQNYAKLEQAVKDTKGLYLVYDGEPILPSYFRVSNGHTRNGGEILHSEKYPYLCSVPCQKDFMAKEYLFEKEIEAAEFCRILGVGEADLHTLSLERDEADYCSLVRIYSQSKKQEVNLSGERFRILFELPSAGFYIELQDRVVRIHVKGVGHGLGMSQFGANEMAKEGQDYLAILSYFFTNIAFDKFE